MFEDYTRAQSRVQADGRDEVIGADAPMTPHHPITEDTSDESRVGAWQTHLRSQIEFARCAVLTPDEREQVVRFVKEQVNLIYYSPSEYPGMFEEVGLVGVRGDLGEDCEPDFVQGGWSDD
jgi:hypothetical protein